LFVFSKKELSTKVVDNLLKERICIIHYLVLPEFLSVCTTNKHSA
jgi:hypothetical protein